MYEGLEIDVSSVLTDILIQRDRPFYFKKLISDLFKNRHMLNKRANENFVTKKTMSIIINMYREEKYD